MSELLRIALVAEGPTDLEIIQAALNAVLAEPFVLTQLQPEPTLPDMGTGWGGVLKWCEAAGQRHGGALNTDPTLAGFDLLIIHLDADVAHAHYADCGQDIPEKALAKGWEALPCHRPCPPATDTCTQLGQTLRSWLAPAAPAPTTVLCLPAQSTGAWLAAAVLPPTHELLTGLECNLKAESRLGSTAIPKTQRIKKQRLAYRQHAPSVSQHWEQVKRCCQQAARFEQDVLCAVRHSSAVQTTAPSR